MLEVLVLGRDPFPVVLNLEQIEPILGIFENTVVVLVIEGKHSHHLCLEDEGVQIVLESCGFDLVALGVLLAYQGLHHENEINLLQGVEGLGWDPHEKALPSQSTVNSVEWVEDGLIGGYELIAVFLNGLVDCVIHHSVVVPQGHLNSHNRALLEGGFAHMKTSKVNFQIIEAVFLNLALEEISGVQVSRRRKQLAIEVNPPDDGAIGLLHELFLDLRLKLILVADPKTICQIDVLVLLEAPFVNELSVSILNLHEGHGLVDLSSCNLIDLFHSELLHPEEL